MIQRRQTVFLFLAAMVILPTIFAPLATFISNGEEIEFFTSGIKSVTGEMIVPTSILYVTTIFACVLALVTIFLYRKRKTQLKLCMIEILTLLCVQIYIGYYTYITAMSVKTVADSTIAISPLAAAPLAGMILCYLAYKGIFRDELLIKSLHRIR